MSAPTDDVAGEIVDAILADLNDRGGLWLDSVDDDTRKDIKAAWRAIVRRHLTVDRESFL